MTTKTWTILSAAVLVPAIVVGVFIAHHLSSEPAAAPQQTTNSNEAVATSQPQAPVKNAPAPQTRLPTPQRESRPRYVTPPLSNGKLAAVELDSRAITTTSKFRVPDADPPELMQLETPTTLPASAPKASVPVASMKSLQRNSPPALEHERRALAADESSITISSGFECSAPLSVIRKSSTHYAVKFEGKRGSLDNYFLFRVEGVKGKTIRIDFEDAPLVKWWSLNPVYSYASDLSDPANFTSVPVANPAKPVAAHNGPLLPDTSGEKWHFMPNVWTEEDGWKGNAGKIKSPIGRLCMVNTFEEDTAYVALKVPYTPSMNERFMESLKANRLCDVIEIGRTRQGRPMHIVRIGGDHEADKTRPCILMYAREHGTEQDSSWVVKGAMSYLASNNQSAASIRQRLTFMFIPVLDPDAASSSTYESITWGFLTASKTPETMAYANWFREWIDLGKRIDLVLNLHNVESSESGHLVCALAEERGDRGRLSDQILAAIAKRGADEYDMGNLKPWNRGWSPDRLGGWLSRRYGPLTIAYEANSQAPKRHLNIQQTKGVGPMIAGGLENFLISDAARLLNEVDQKRQDRLQRWRESHTEYVIDAIDFEARVSPGVGVARPGHDETQVERWR